MKYQVAYMGTFPAADRIAQEITLVLPAEETRTVDLTRSHVSYDSDVYVIGFGLKRGVLPLQIMELLEMLNGKTILFFVFCGAEPVEEYAKVIEYTLAPFMPDHYDYRGMILCPAKIAKETADAAYQLLKEDPENEYAARVVQQYESAEDNPNEEELQKICRFVKDKLGLMP